MADTDGKKPKPKQQTSEASEEVSEVKGSNEQQDSAKANTQERPIVKKAGKHSAKGLAEANEKQKKIDKQKSKPSASDQQTKTTQSVKPPRTKAERNGKNYKKAIDLIDKTKEYSLAEAVKLVAKTSFVKFDASVELHIKLNVDPKQSDQNVRGTMVLPAGTGKTQTIAVLTDDQKSAKAAGADIIYGDDLYQKLDKGEIDFDVLITEPSKMRTLSKYAKLLGPKGKMPNPKNGTVTQDIENAIRQSKSGKVEFRVDAAGIVHLVVGKVSFDSSDLLKNINEAYANIKSNKPSGIKGQYVRSSYLSTSMGPSIKLDVSEV